jgi:ketosteroid isomerase-like protein
MSADSVKAMFTTWRNGFKTVDVKMEDWESVISKDKKQEWVTLWYTQKWEDTKGKKDSAAYIDDLQMKDGKIVRLDEYTRKMH